MDVGSIRKAFDTVMMDVMESQVTEMTWVWLGVNARLVPNPSRLWIMSSLLPGRSESAELGGPEALALRSGVYMVSFSFPERTAVDPVWRLALAMEARFRRANIATDACRVWCDEPWTENHGTSVEKGRCVLTTNIPWTCAHN